jgi:serine/threonine protein kinase
MTSSYTERETAGEDAHEQMRRIASQSKLSRYDSQVHHYSWSDIVQESSIGTGSFSQIFRVHVVDSSTLELEDSSNRNTTTYALKCLKTKALASKDFVQGAIDLAVEGEILSRLCHENIIQLHGVKSGDPAKAYTDSINGYFLLLELLEDSLTKRLEHLRQKKRKERRRIRSKGCSLTPFLEMIENVAIGVAMGMQYLHQNGVVLRDLKPDNIGFDKDGNPKIFDLGFARELHTIETLEIAGSLRYMAPEVASGNGCSFASDVYSFGVLLFEICTLEKPFKKFKSREEFMEEVVRDNYRPRISSIPSQAIQRLIEACWNEDPAVRPYFVRIVKTLKAEVVLGRALKIELSSANKNHPSSPSKLSLMSFRGSSHSSAGRSYLEDSTHDSDDSSVFSFGSLHTMDSSVGSFASTS